MKFFKMFSLVDFSIQRPKLVLLIAALVTLTFFSQFPKIRTDTNPKNMLPATSDVRVWNNEVDKTFSLYEDIIVLGIVNPNGILNPETLGRIQRITDQIIRLKGVAAVDVSGFTTIDNVTVDGASLRVSPLMTTAPKNTAEVEALRKNLFGNRMFVGRLISEDGKTTAIYAPLEKGANGQEIAEQMREIVKKENGPENYYVAGDPVARDPFGAVMFKLMAAYSPIAGMVMFLGMFLMFRNMVLPSTMMLVAMMSIIWSMGLLIGLGFPVHIMSSMSPVFLMAIATDSIHIFNEFYFRYRESKDKKTAIRDTMTAVGRPVRYTALTTAAGFAVLMFMNIIPVKVFGGLVAFGTIALRFLSFSVIPAILTLVKEDKLKSASVKEDSETGWMAKTLSVLGGVGTHKPVLTVVVGLALVVAASVGTTRLVVNNNMVEWFKASSEIRTADTVMNRALGGTSLGYLVAISNQDDFIKTPEAMRYIEGLQRHLESLSVVGKTTSVVDFVKRINKVLHADDPKYDTIPATKEAIGQYLFLFSMSAKPADLDNVVDYPFRKANIWVQLKTWDAGAMRDVIRAAEEYKKTHPIDMELRPAGTAYFNLIWNDEVLGDMSRGFIIALVVVFALLTLNFRSVKWAAVSYIPLLFTILLIYGAIGFAGKTVDMPISVLSCLSLGMAVDFSIHFINRFKQHLSENATPGRALNRASITDALLWTAARPGKGILRNALLFASAFSVMMFAPLTPYITVGAFILSMMVLSALFTIIYLPALIVLLRKWLFKDVTI